MKTSRRYRHFVSILSSTVLLTFMLLVPAFTAAQGLELTINGEPVLPELTLPQLFPAPTGTTNPAPASGANAETAVLDLDPILQVDVGTSGAGYTNPETGAVSQGSVDAVAVQVGDSTSIGIQNADSAYRPGEYLTGGIRNFGLPGILLLDLANYRTESVAFGSGNYFTLSRVWVQALGLDLIIPVIQSNSSTYDTGGTTTSGSFSGVVASEDQGPVVIGKGILVDDGLASVQLLSAGSTSTADGKTAQNTATWTFADLWLAGIPVVIADDQNGVMVADMTIIPAPEGGNSALLAIEPLDGALGIFLGEKYSNTDGATFANGGADNLRISLLGSDLLVVGNAETAAVAQVENEIGPPPGNPPEDVPSDSTPVPADGSRGIIESAGLFLRQLPYTGMELGLPLLTMLALALSWMAMRVRTLHAQASGREWLLR